MVTKDEQSSSRGRISKQLQCFDRVSTSSKIVASCFGGDLDEGLGGKILYCTHTVLARCLSEGCVAGWLPPAESSTDFEAYQRTHEVTYRIYDIVSSFSNAVRHLDGRDDSLALP
jgi:hypothetical protein